MWIWHCIHCAELSINVSHCLSLWLLLLCVQKTAQMLLVARTCSHVFKDKRKNIYISVAQETPVFYQNTSRNPFHSNSRAYSLLCKQRCLLFALHRAGSTAIVECRVKGVQFPHPKLCRSVIDNTRKPIFNKNPFNLFSKISKYM